MGPDFYLACRDVADRLAKEGGPRIEFAMQTNLLLYETSRWADVFREVFKGRISSSYDPDEKFRTLKGSTLRYTNRFFGKLDQVLADGFRPMVIGTFDEKSASLANRFYELSLSQGEGKQFPIRLNYRYPIGRAEGAGETISPETYGRMLVDLFDRWIVDAPGFSITPLDQMLKLVLGLESDRCPWTSKCASSIMEIGPDGSVHTCGEFADLGDPAFRYGNLNDSDGRKLVVSQPAVMIRRRMTNLPPDCMSCRHFGECGGGCMRDSVLYQHGLYGKFHYCLSWQMVFDRIKEAVSRGETDKLIHNLRMAAM